MFPRLNTSTSRRTAGLAYIVLLALAAAQLWSQSLSGINGTVTDSTGGVVKDAKVTVLNNDTGVVKTAVTSSAGTYTITDLLPGRYTVTFDSTGFQSSIHKGVGVEVGRVASVDGELLTGSTTQTIEVKENVIVFDTFVFNDTATTE